MQEKAERAVHSQLEASAAMLEFLMEDVYKRQCMDCVAGGKSGCIYEFPGIGGVFLQTQSICR